jgi:hypothetical protein
LVDEIERLAALDGYELVNRFAPGMLPAAEPAPEPVPFEEALVRGEYLGRPGWTNKTVPVDPDYLRQYRACEAREAVSASACRRGPPLGRPRA